MNRLAQSVYSMMQAENSQNVSQLTASEQMAITELAEFRQTLTAETWAIMANTFWYPIVDETQSVAEHNK